MSQMAAGPWLTWSHHRLEADSDIVTAASPQSWVLARLVLVRLVLVSVSWCVVSACVSDPALLGSLSLSHPARWLPWLRVLMAGWCHHHSRPGFQPINNTSSQGQSGRSTHQQLVTISNTTPAVTSHLVIGAVLLYDYHC